MKQEDIFWKRELKFYEDFSKENPESSYEDYDPIKSVVFLNVTDYFFKKLKIKKPDVLELGCGGGLGLCYLAKKGSKCVGVDYSDYSLKYAAKLIKEKKVSKNVKLVKKDIYKTDYDKEFDLVFNSGVFEHLSLKNQRIMMGKMVKASRKYVCVIIPNLNSGSLFEQFSKIVKKKGRFYDIPHKKIDILKLFREFKIKKVDVEGFGIFTGPKIVDQFYGLDNFHNKIKSYMNRREKQKLKNFPNTDYDSSHVKLLAQLERRVPKAYRLKYGFLKMYLGEI